MAMRALVDFDSQPRRRELVETNTEEFAGVTEAWDAFEGQSGVGAVADIGDGAQTA